MSNSPATKMKWCGTDQNLLNLFIGRIDKEVIEEIILYHNNDLSQAYDYLNDIATISDPQQNVHLSPSKEKNEIVAAVEIDSLNWGRLSKNESPIDRVMYLVSKGYKTMVLMRGCPGSGKSYQAINILNRCYKNANVDEFIFGADKFFTDKHTGRYHFNSKKLSAAHQWNYENAQKAVLREVTPVIIDNTNTQAWEMENYLKLGVNNGYWIEIVEPSSEWAWDGVELFKKNLHTVPYDTITLMLSRYEHNIDVDSLLTKFKLKYNKKNQPPLLSNLFKNNQLNENIVDIIVENKPETDTDLLVNNNFKDMHISQEHENNNEKQTQCTSFNDSDEDPWVLNTLQEKELAETTDFDDCISDADEENRSVSPSDEASNYIHKSVNTYENDFLFMEVLNELPEEEYSNYVVYGKNRDINEGNTNVVIIPCERLDKSTTTNDLKDVVYKPNLEELLKQFPKNMCLLIIELFEKCEGDVDWIVDMLVESGYNVSKQQLLSSFQSKENDLYENVNENVKDTIDESKFDSNLLFSFPNLPPNAATLIDNGTLVETQCKKKERKFLPVKAKKSSLIDSNLRKDIENKFTFGDSLYSEHVLKIKKLKDNQNIFNFDNVMLPTQMENAIGDSERNNEEKFVQLVVDPAVLAQLCDYFGDFSSDLNKSSLPMSVKLPEKLAEDLYYCLIANVPSDIFDQETILKDEMLARKLQEGFKEEYVSNIANPCTSELSFAAVLSKKLLLEKFKHLDPKLVLKVLAANDYKLQKASHVLSEASGIECLTNQENMDTVENEETRVIDDKYDKPNSNQNYRQDALNHAHTRQIYLNKANQSWSSKIHPSVTGYYLDKAEESKKNEKYSNTKAVLDMLKNCERTTTLDLHYFPVQQALLILDLYLDSHILLLKKYNGQFSRGKQLTVITGRGKHSPKGISRIKPAVVQRLQARRLMYLEPETPGVIMVIVKRTSFLSESYTLLQ